MTDDTFEASTLLGGLLAGIPDPTDAGVGADSFETLPNGAAAVVILPNGRRYRVSVERVADDDGSGS